MSEKKTHKIKCDDHKCNCFSRIVCVVLNSWTVLRQLVWLTWKIIWFPVKLYLLSFCFTLAIEIACDGYYCCYMCVLCLCLSPAIYIWSTIAFTATVLIVWLCWLRFLFDDHVFLSISCSILKFNNNKSTILLVVFLSMNLYLCSSFYCCMFLMGFVCTIYLLMTWCDVFNLCLFRD